MKGEKDLGKEWVGWALAITLGNGVGRGRTRLLGGEEPVGHGAD